MAELVQDVVGQKAVDDVEGLLQRLLKVSDVIDEINKKGRSMEAGLKVSKDFESTSSIMEKLEQNASDLTKAQIDFQKAIKETDEKLKNYGTDIQANIRVQLNYKSELKDVQEEIKKLSKSANEYGSASVGVRDKVVNLIQKEKELKVAISENEQLIKAQAKANAANAGSIDQLSAKLGHFRDIFRQLSAEDREGVVGQGLLKTVQQLDPAVKAFDASTGNFQRNVGNYTGAFTEAFAVLKSELESARQKLAQMNSEDAAFEELKKKEMALDKATTGLNRTFNSTREELRAFQEASKNLGLTLGDDADTFNHFAAEVGKSKDQIEDLQAKVNFNASDSKYLDGAIEGLQTLTGLYGIAEGAATLFGQSQEDLQKQMVVLQSIMTITNGLQQVQISIQSESAAMQTLLAVQTKALSASRAVETAINNLANASTRANTLEKIKNQAATVANTVVTGAQTAATSLYTFVTNGATVATRLFRAALLATGVGTIIVLIGSLVEAISAYSESAKKATEDTEDWSKAVEEMAGTTDRANETIARNAKIALSAAKARGASADDLSKIENNATELRLRNLRDERDAAAKKLQTEKLSVKEYEALRDLEAKRSKEIADLEADVQIDKNEKIADANKKAADKRKKEQEDYRKSLEELNKVIVEIRMQLLVPSEEEVKQAVADIQQIVDGKKGVVFQDAEVITSFSNITGSLADLSSEAANELLGIERAFQMGLYKTTEAYERAKTDSVAKYAEKRLDIEIEGLNKLITFLPKGSEKRAEIQAKIDDLELKRTEAVNEKRIASEKQTAEKTNEEKEKAIAKFEMLSRSAVELTSSIGSALSSIYDAKIAKLQEINELIDKNLQDEVAAIAATTLTEEEKQRRIKEAEGKAQLQKEANEKKIAELKVRQARLDKAAAMANIIQNTASAVTAALKLPPPFNAIMAATYAATGAAQLAAVAARPIPKYEKGTKDSEGGPAVVSEKGSELVIEPDGSMWVTPPKESIVTLRKHSTVIPHDQLVQMTQRVMMENFPANTHQEAVFDDSNIVDALSQNNAGIRKMLQELQQANAINKAGINKTDWRYRSTYVNHLNN